MAIIVIINGLKGLFLVRLYILSRRTKLKSFFQADLRSFCNMTFKTACDTRASSGITQAKRCAIEQQQEAVREALADIDLFEVRIGQKDVSEARRLRSSSACSGLNLPVSERPPSPISCGFYDYSQTPRKTRTLNALQGTNYNRAELKLGAASSANVPEGVIATNHGKLEWVVEKIVLKPRTTGITSVTARRVQSAGDSLWRPGTSSTQRSILRGGEYAARSSSRWCQARKCALCVFSQSLQCGSSIGRHKAATTRPQERRDDEWEQ